MNTVRRVLRENSIEAVRKVFRENSIETPQKKAKKHWREVYDRYDKNKDGFICVKELDELIQSQSYEQDIPEHVVEKIHDLADVDQDGRLNFNEFVQMIQDPALRPLFGSLVNSYVQTIVPCKSSNYNQKTETTGEYEDAVKCCPPPCGMILISIIEIIIYCIDVSTTEKGSEMGPVADALVYDPRRRYEAWRYVTYMFVHIGVIHLVVNLCVQILLGTALELVHKWWRVLIIYSAGVLAGSLGTSITDPTVKLAGASGGAYALITAHISTIIMNWKEMEYAAVQLIIFLIITVCDIGTAIYDRHILNRNEHIGYAAHFAGAIAGLLVGIHIVRNIHVTRTERILWWVSTITYILLMGTAIVWNIAYVDYFPPQVYDKS